MSTESPKRAETSRRAVLPSGRTHVLRSEAARILVLAVLVALVPLVACRQLIGLDELRERDGDTTSTSHDAGEDVLAAECTTNATCFVDGPGRCVDGKCVPVKTPEGICIPQVLPSDDVLKNDDALLVAAFLPILGEQSALTSGNALAFILALEELNTWGKRPMGLVICANNSDQAHPDRQVVVQRSFEHAVDELRVPAIVAGFAPSELQQYVTAANEKGVFTLNPGRTSEVLKYSNIPLMLNLLGTSEDVALAYRPLLTSVENHIKQTVARDIKVALLYSDTPAEGSMYTVLTEGAFEPASGGRDATKALSFNEKSLRQNGDAGHFLTIKIDSEDFGLTPQYTSIDQQLRAFAPDVVIALTSTEVTKIIRNLEEETPLDGSDGGAPSVRPHWLLGPRNNLYMLAYVNEYVAALPRGGGGYDSAVNEKLRRLRGVNFAGAATEDDRQSWIKRMKDRFPSPISEDRYSTMENYYDAIYWLAYGLNAAGPNAPLVGNSISLGVSLIWEPVREGAIIIRPGGDQEINGAIQKLQLVDTRRPASYVGALGPPDVDPKRRTWNSVGGVYCFKREIQGPQLVSDALRYDRTSGELDEVKTDCQLF